MSLMVNASPTREQHKFFICTTPSTAPPRGRRQNRVVSLSIGSFQRDEGSSPWEMKAFDLVNRRERDSGSDRSATAALSSSSWSVSGPMIADATDGFRGSGQCRLPGFDRRLATASNCSAIASAPA